MTKEIETLFDARNQIAAPITDPLYADSLALRSYMESYDYIVSQPSVLTREQGERMLEIMAEGYKPLPAEPLPIEETEG